MVVESAVTENFGDFLLHQSYHQTLVRIVKRDRLIVLVVTAVLPLASVHVFAVSLSSNIEVLHPANEKSLQQFSLQVMILTQQLLGGNRVGGVGIPKGDIPKAEHIELLVQVGIVVFEWSGREHQHTLDARPIPLAVRVAAVGVTQAKTEQTVAIAHVLAKSVFEIVRLIDH